MLPFIKGNTWGEIIEKGFESVLGQIQGKGSNIEKSTEM